MRAWWTHLIVRESTRASESIFSARCRLEWDDLTAPISQMCLSKQSFLSPALSNSNNHYPLCSDSHKNLFYARRFKLQYWPSIFFPCFYGRDTKSFAINLRRAFKKANICHGNFYSVTLFAFVYGPDENGRDRPKRLKLISGQFPCDCNNHSRTLSVNFAAEHRLFQLLHHTRGKKNQSNIIFFISSSFSRSLSFLFCPKKAKKRQRIA